MDRSDEEELEMVRSLLEAEQSNDREGVGKAQAKFLRSVSASLSDNEDRGNSKVEDRSVVSKKETTRSKVSKRSSHYTSGGRNYQTGAGMNGSNEDGWKQSVARLLKQKRHKQPVIVQPDMSILLVARKLSEGRKSAALVRDEVSGKIIGIITDADICRRVVAKKIPFSTKVVDVMTPNPISVGPETNIIKIFDIMCRNRFRHLPVLDDQKETVYGLVDIAQCLYDAIKRIESAQRKEMDFMHTVQRAHLRWKSDHEETGVTAVLAQQIINDLMEKICPKVAIILENSATSERDKGTLKDQTLMLSPDETVQSAAEVMSTHRKTAVLGLYSEKKESDGQAEFGIFTTKDLMRAVVAKELNPSEVTLGQVMTRNPDTVDAQSSLLDALHIMHDGRFLHAPVVSIDADTETETPIGILDVLDCAVHTLSRFTKDKADSHVVGEETDAHEKIYGASVDPKADREMFTALFLRDDLSEPSRSEPQSASGGNVVHVHDSVSQTGQRHSVQGHGTEGSRFGAEQRSTTFGFKIKNLQDNQIYKLDYVVKEATSFKHAKALILQAVFGDQVEDIPAHSITLHYLDEDNDEIFLNSDISFETALNLIRNQSLSKLTILLRVRGMKSSTSVINQAGVSNVAIYAMLGMSCLAGVVFGALLLSGNRSRNPPNNRHTYKGYPAYR